MINIWIVISIIFIHWIADFVLQTDKMAQGKSKNWNDLLNHTITYSVIWLGVIALSAFFIKVEIKFLLFPVITFICHTATDYYTSRVHSKLYDDKQYHDFFTSIGFDQVLHYVQLILTYYLLTNINI